MENYVNGKVLLITGAASGFGKGVSKLAAEMGGKIICADMNEEGLKETVSTIKAQNGEAEYIVTNVTDRNQVEAMASFAVETYGRIDVLVNSAGTMPIAFFSDHQKAWQAWDNCIDTNIKGTLYCISAVYDQMVAQGQGQIINFSSIHGIFPNAGAGVYAMSKVAARYLTESLRQEVPGVIKTTVVYPTAVDDTGLVGGVINWDAANSLYTEKGAEFYPKYYESAEIQKETGDREKINYACLDPVSMCEQILYVINQPWGVNISEITVRASGDMYR